MRAFIPDRMTGSRYMDSGRREWIALNLEYGLIISGLADVVIGARRAWSGRSRDDDCP
jgi:hypothetical protein